MPIFLPVKPTLLIAHAAPAPDALRPPKSALLFIFVVVSSCSRPLVTREFSCGESNAGTVVAIAAGFALHAGGVTLIQLKMARNKYCPAPRPCPSARPARDGLQIGVT